MRAAPRTLDLRARRWRTTAVVATAALLASSAVALGALPKHGASFKGKINGAVINGFVAPVSFKVASNGKSLTGFQYSSFGCFGAGGFRPGIDYYTQPDAIIKVGTVKVTANGHFSVTGATFSHTSFGNKFTTTTNVTGVFTKSKAAKGTIVLSQKATGKFNSTCGPGTITFTASAH
jgi:hypothetical protein